MDSANRRHFAVVNDNLNIFNQTMNANEQSPSPTVAVHSRREFLCRASASACAGALAAAKSLPQPLLAAQKREARPKVMIGSGMYGWGQYYRRDKKNIADHMDEALAAIRDCGYEFAEGFVDVKVPDNNGKFADQMKAKGLKPVCIYTGAALHEQGKAEETVDQLLKAAKVCAQAGFTVIDCNPQPIGRDKTDDELKTQSAALTRLGKELKALGLRLAIHNHMPEMKNEARELHHNFRTTDPKLVGFCIDVDWVHRGGMDPLKALELYGDRVLLWHLRQDRDGVWWEDLDTGDIDYSAIAKHAKTRGIPPIYSVELAIEKETKITRSCVENHRRSCEFAKRVFS